MPALPTNPPTWDILFLSGSSFGSIFTYSGVITGGDTGQFTDNATNLVMSSGGTFDTTDLQLYLDVPVDQPFTFEAVINFNALPANFTDLLAEHVYLGASNASGPTFGLFVSKIGLAYAGSIHHDGSGNMVLDSAVQPLPNSQNFITEGVQTTIRVATDIVTGATYVYVTPTADVPVVGEQLRYVLPALASANMVQGPPDEVQFSVLGLLSRPAQMTLYEVAVGTGLHIPVVMPIADAGNDQAVRTCQIIQLNGSRSTDPQGGSLTYLWQLVDAPQGSKFSVDGNDGETFPLSIPTGFTNKFYSASLGVLNGTTPIVLGTDVIVVQGSPYVITAVGTDGHGFFVQIGPDDFPDSLPPFTPFKFLPQLGISNPTNVLATFFPDIPGLYKFNLTVSNGALSSFPAETIANVTTSFLPRGLTPDMTFLWNYLPDFWRLLEDPERISVFWSALAQCISTELLTLWQVDYSKSLRDVQRTFQRRWLHYDMALNEQSALVESTTVRAVFGGIESTSIATAGVAGVNGNHLDLFLSTQAQPVVITFTGSTLQTAQQIADRINAFMSGIDPRLIARVIPRRDGTAQRVRLDAPYPFMVASTSTVTLFTGSNGLVQGTAGAVVGTNTYRVERSLTQVPIQPGDYLTVGADTFRISSVTDNAADPFFNQRIITKDPIPVTAGTTWLVSGQVVSPSLDFYNGLVEAGDAVTLEVIDTTTSQIAFVPIPVTGVSSQTTSILGVDASLVGQYLSDTRYEVFFTKVVRRQYTPINDLVVDVPYLQELINNTDDSLVLRRNLDYFIDTFRGNPCVRFVVSTNPARDVWAGQVPPDRMWAEMTYIDNRPRIEANFGIPAEFTLDDLSQLPSNVDYLSAVKGLWFSYFNGPVIFNLRVGAQILLGLPYAEEAGTIVEIRNDFSTTTGRILMQDAANAEITRSYTYPPSLAIETNPATGQPYKVGDTVKQFAPLVQGVQILDYVNSPKWFAGLIGQGTFTEIEKYFKFMIRVNSAAFNLSALLFVQSFIKRIKPTYTLPLFVIQETIPASDIEVTDSVTLSGVLSLFESPGFAPPHNIAGMWDQPKETGGGYWGEYDSNGVVPMYDTPTLPVAFGFDRILNSPDYFIAATVTQTVPGGLPTFDAIFSYDLPLFSNKIATFGGHTFHAVPHTEPGVSLGTVTFTGSVSANFIYFETAGSSDGFNPYNLEFWLNGVLSFTQSVELSAAGRGYEAFPVSLSYGPGDVLELRLLSTLPDSEPWVHDIMVVLGNGTIWAFDTVVTGGTYERYRSL